MFKTTLYMYVNDNTKKHKSDIPHCHTISMLQGNECHVHYAVHLSF